MSEDRRDPEVPSSVVTRAMVLLVSMRVVYAYNWFDVGPGLPLISRTYGGVPASEWGLLLAAFFAGAGALQVPAGLLSRRYGTRTLSLVGAALLGVCSLLSAIAPTFWLLLLLRALSGAGAGLFFSPAIALVATLYPPGKRGIPVGAFSSAFAAGAGLGTFVPAVLDPIVGWEPAVALGGGAMLLLFLMGAAWVPRTPGTGPAPRGPPPPFPPPALRSRAVWGIGLAFVGLEGASLSSGQFFVPYAESATAGLGWAASLAGAVGALFVFPSLFGGPLGGRLTERFSNRRTQMAVFTAVPAALLALIPFAGVVGVAAIATCFSFTFGMVYAMMYVIPPYLPGLTMKDTPLAIGLLNGIQLAGGATVAFVSGWVIATYGYSKFWGVLALLVIVPLVFLLWVPARRRSSLQSG